MAVFINKVNNKILSSVKIINFNESETEKENIMINKKINEQKEINERINERINEKGNNKRIDNEINKQNNIIVSPINFNPKNGYVYIKPVQINEQNKQNNVH